MRFRLGRFAAGKPQLLLRPFALLRSRAPDGFSDEENATLHGLHFTPVLCSRTNQVEQRISTRQQERLLRADFADKNYTRGMLSTSIEKRSEYARPFRLNATSVAKAKAKAARKRQEPAPA